MKKADSRFFQKHFSPDDFAARRARLMDEIGPDAHVLLRGRIEKHGPMLLQGKTFFYFTGLVASGAVVLISGPDRTATAYLPHRNPEQNPEDSGLGVEDAAEIVAGTGLDAVLEIETLEADLRGVKTVYVQDAEDELPFRTRFEAAHIAALRAQHPWDGRDSESQRFTELLKERIPGVTIEGLTPIVAEMRRVKDEHEIEMLRRAGYLSGLATKEAMRMTRPGMIERQLSALASYVYLSHGASGESYPQIVAAGANMPVGHYCRNDAELVDGDIVLMDSAPDYTYYASDIGRIWPVNGTYAPWQRELYGYICVYHRTLLRLLRPGRMHAEICAEAAEIMSEVVASTSWSKPIYKAAAESVLRSKNPLSHPVGLSVHDGSPYKHKPLEPGVVISVDPMMSVHEEGLYIRAEDTVLITEDGHENFTGGAPLDPDEIEATMKEPGIYPLYDTVQAWDPGRKM